MRVVIDTNVLLNLYKYDPDVTHQWFDTDPPERKKINMLRDYIDAELAGPAEQFKALGEAGLAVGTSKTFRSLARLTGAAPSSAGPFVQRTLTAPGLRQLIAFADQGADVVSVQRPGVGVAGLTGVPSGVKRNRTIVEADLKNPADIAAILDLIDRADVIVEGFRPGVMERLGLGPDVVLERNPRIVFARMTGWGQDGPLAQVAGHDINYLSQTGVLSAIGSTVPTQFMLMLPYVITILAVAGFIGQSRPPAASGKPYVKQ